MEKKVLIVEDHLTTAEMISSILYEYTTVAAYDGKSGLQKVAEEKPDLIITDILLPDMIGIDLIKKVKSDPATAHIPVIAISVKVEKHDVDAAREAGAAEYLKKPFDPKEFREKVKHYLAE
jgi:CheY-like chemotaxis protein